MVQQMTGSPFYGALVTSDEEASRYHDMAGNQSYVMPNRGNEFVSNIAGTNVTIASGEMCIFGRHWVKTALTTLALPTANGRYTLCARQVLTPVVNSTFEYHDEVNSLEIVAGEWATHNTPFKTLYNQLWGRVPLYDITIAGGTLDNIFAIMPFFQTFKQRSAAQPPPIGTVMFFVDNTVPGTPGLYAGTTWVQLRSNVANQERAFVFMNRAAATAPIYTSATTQLVGQTYAHDHTQTHTHTIPAAVNNHTHTISQHQHEITPHNHTQAAHRHQMDATLDGTIHPEMLRYKADATTVTGWVFGVPGVGIATWATGNLMNNATYHWQVGNFASTNGSTALDYTLSDTADLFNPIAQDQTMTFVDNPAVSVENVSTQPFSPANVEVASLNSISGIELSAYYRTA